MLRLLIDNDGTIGFGEPPRVVRNKAVFALAHLPCYTEVSIFTHGGAKQSKYEQLMNNEISLAQFKKFVYTGAINEWKEAGKISKVYTTYDIAWGKGPGKYYEEMIEPVERALIEIKEHFDKGCITQEQANARYAELRPHIEEMRQFERNGVGCVYDIENAPGNQLLYDAIPGLQKKLADFKEFFTNSSKYQASLQQLAVQYNEQILKQTGESDLTKEQILELLSVIDPRHSKENAEAYLSSISSKDGTLNTGSIGYYEGSFQEDLAPTIREITKKGLGYKQIQLENPYLENQMFDDSPENLAYMEAANRELGSLATGNSDFVVPHLTTALITMREDRIGKSYQSEDLQITRSYLFSDAEILNELCVNSPAMQAECEKAYEICQSLVNNNNPSQKGKLDTGCSTIVQNANKISGDSKHPVWLQALHAIRYLTIPQTLKDKKNLELLVELLNGEPQIDPQRLHNFIVLLVKHGDSEFARKNFRDSFLYYKAAYLFLDPAYAAPNTIEQFKNQVVEKMQDAYTNERLQPNTNQFDNSFIHELNAQIESSGLAARLRVVQLYMDLHRNVSRFAYADQGYFGFRQSLFAKTHPPVENDSLFSKKIVDCLIKTMEIYPSAEQLCKTKLATLQSTLSDQAYKNVITTKLDLYEQRKTAVATEAPTIQPNFN